MDKIEAARAAKTLGHLISRRELLWTKNALGTEIFSDDLWILRLTFSLKILFLQTELFDFRSATGFARILAEEDIASNSSEESTEDENADLLTGKVETKIFETLSKIKAKDPSIYETWWELRRDFLFFGSLNL